MNPVKIEAVKSYVTKILWARMQWDDKPFDVRNLIAETGEGIRGNCCSYCKIHDHDCTDCKLKPHPKEQCCEGLWAKMRDSETCGEFEQRATDVLQYICEEG